MTAVTPLAANMRARADTFGLPADHKLRTLADALDEANDRLTREGSSPERLRGVLGCWARARRAWCDHTGESLI